MNRNTVFRVALGCVVAAACLLVNERAPLTKGAFLVTTADAVIGRPLTPVSYAGVARRTTRRAVAVGAAAAPVVVAPAPVVVAPGPGCVQVVNSYGQIMWRCP